MRNHSWILLLVFSFGMGVRPSMADSTNQAAPSFLSQWIEAQKGMADMRVNFKLTRTVPTLKEPVVTSGHFWRFNDGRFRWETGDPPTMILIYDKGAIRAWDSAEPQWRTLSPKDASMRMWMPFLSGKDLSSASLEKDFTATITEQIKKSVTVVLVPKSSGLRRHLKQVELKIDPTKKHLLQLGVVQADESKMLMSFAEPEPMMDADKNVLLIPVGTRPNS